MNKSDAQDASQTLAPLIAADFNDPHVSREVEHRVHRAVHDHLREMVPYSATYAVIQGTGGLRAVAVHDGKLYEVAVGEVSEGRGPVPTTLRVRSIDPMTASVDCEAKYSGHRDPDLDLQVTRETVWNFRVSDIDLRFETHVSRDRSWVERDETFAVALAKEIGMEIPAAVEPQPLVAVI